jgi:hypothetical protein
VEIESGRGRDSWQIYGERGKKVGGKIYSAREAELREKATAVQRKNSE